MAIKEWETDYPTSQDPDPVTDVQPNLDDESYPGALDGDATRSSQIEALRDKLHAVCKYVGDASNLPSGSLRDRVNKQSSSFAYGSATTVDGTSTNPVTLALTDNRVYWFKARFIGRDRAGTHRCTYFVNAMAYRQGGGATLGSSSPNAAFTDETNASLNGTIGVSSNSVVFTVTGLPAVIIDWDVVVEYHSIASAA